MRHRVIVVAAILSTLTVAGAGAGQRGAGPGATGAPAPAIGLIVGRVLDAGTGQPLAEAEVTVAMRAAPAVAGGPGGPQVGAPAAMPMNVRLLTGPDGRFVVRDLPAGNVQLSAKAPGYLAGNFGQSRPGGLSQPIQISAENRIVTASVRLWKHAVVTGMVTDESNEPAINVQVRAMVRSFKSGQPRFASSGFGRTDDRGVYRITGLAPGDYVVVVPQTQSTMPVATMDNAMQSMLGGQGLGAASAELVASGIGVGGTGTMGVRVGDQLVNSLSGALPVMSGDGRMAAYVTQYHPAANTSAEATVFSLGSGEERGGVDIRMPLVATARISGTVIGPDGPLANVPIRLLHPTEADTGDSFSDVARSATAANGTFQMFGVPAGQYLLKVLRPAQQPMPAAFANNPQMAALMGGRGAGPISPSDALTLFADVPLSVERDVTDITITLSTGATVSGRVDFVGTAALPPFTGISVTLSGIGGASFLARPSNVGEDGRFVTGGTAAGKYFVSVSGRTPNWFVKSAMVNGIDALDQPFELGTENIGNVVVTFTDRQTVINGTVTGANGAPAEGTVVIFPAAYREWISKGMSPRLMRTVRAPQKGAFTINGMPAREYLIVALADEQVPDVQNPGVFEALARAATTLTLADGETRVLSIKMAQVVR